MKIGSKFRRHKRNTTGSCLGESRYGSLLNRVRKLQMHLLKILFGETGCSRVERSQRAAAKPSTPKSRRSSKKPATPKDLSNRPQESDWPPIRPTQPGWGMNRKELWQVVSPEQCRQTLVRLAEGYEKRPSNEGTINAANGNHKG